MDIELYVYDLSRGLARTMSAALLGIQIDAIYHTSIIMQGIEFVYDGGIKTIVPGESHLGKPIQVIPLGRTALPTEIIMDYLESLRHIYTAEAYDLWGHNCNNFSNDFATFLTGKGIPSHITNLPQTVLDTPFGRMLRPKIDDMMINNRRNKQTPMLGLANDSNTVKAPETTRAHAISVKVASTTQELDTLLDSAKSSCAVLFFTSKTCPPCKPLYPVYHQLALELGSKAVLVKVEIDNSQNIARKFSITATPTFITFLNGVQERRWSGADPHSLRQNVTTLAQMAWPPHLHESLRLPAFRGVATSPIIFNKVPPLDKLILKIGNVAKDPALQGVKKFVAKEQANGASESTLPDLDGFSRFLRGAIGEVPVEVMFPIVDLMRVSMADPRFSGYFAEEKDHKTIAPLLEYVNNLEKCPYSLRLVTLQMTCNLFSSPLYIGHILSCETLTAPIVQLITTSLLDETHHNVRVAASSLAFNIATTNSRARTEQKREALPEEDQVALAAALLEAISVESQSADALKGYLLAFGFLVYCASKDGELVDLLRSLDAKANILGKSEVFPDEGLISEVGNELIGKGLS